MHINEAQKAVDDWIRRYGVRYFNELTNMALLTEEVGELARIVARTYGEQSFKKGEMEGMDEAGRSLQMADEMADILFVIICLANQTGIDLEAALERNLQKKSARDFDRHQQNDKLR
ncbi:MAG: nucleotide pyrophosphohydrolase [Bacteroidales bacterium]